MQKKHNSLPAKWLLLSCALALGCQERTFNSNGKDGATSSGQAQSLRAGRDGDALNMVALKDTVFKSLSGGTKESSAIAVEQKCFLRKGTRLVLSSRPQPAKAGHFLVRVAGEIPAVKSVSEGAASSAQVPFPRFNPPQTSPVGGQSSSSSPMGTTEPQFASPLTGVADHPPERSVEPPDPTREDNDRALNLADKPDAFANSSVPCPFQEGYVFDADWDGAVLPASTPAEELVQNFLTQYRSCASGASYSLGSGTCGRALDCSSSIRNAYQRMGVNMSSTQADQDANFTSCRGGPRPGDHLLLAKPGRDPDHWVTLVKVNVSSPANSSANLIVDVSSDCNGLCPVTNIRSNLSNNRYVYACARWKKLDQAWNAQ